MQTLLLTGFEPFGSHTANPTQRLVEELDGHVLSNGVQISTLLLPVAGEAAVALQGKVTEQQPEVVIALGQAANRAAVTPEKVAINYANYPIADNYGEQLCNTTVVEDAPDAYFSSLPVEHMVAELERSGIRARLSLTAGSYVCNYLFFSLLHFVHQHDDKIKAGFIHCPIMAEQADQGQPCMDYATIKKAILLCCEQSFFEGETIAPAQGVIS